LIKKSKKIKKEQTNKLNAECSAIRENESNSYGLNESCEIFDDDLSVKEENEASFIFFFIKLLIFSLILTKKKGS